MTTNDVPLAGVIQAGGGELNAGDRSRARVRLRRSLMWIKGLAWFGLGAGAVLMVADLDDGILRTLGHHWMAIAGAVVVVAALAALLRAGINERGMVRSGVEEGLPPESPRIWVGEQIAYYRSEVIKNFLGFTVFKVPAMLAAAALPVIAIVAEEHTTQWAAGLLGAVIVFLDGMQHLYRYRENWLSAVQTRETLEHEVQRYGVRAGPYAPPANRDIVLIDRATAIVAEEFSTWMAGHQNQQEQPRGAGEPKGGASDGKPGG